jgi:putative transposase
VHLSVVADLLADESEDDLFDRLRAAESIGRPLGNDRSLARLERGTGRASSQAAWAEAAGKKLN